MQQSWFTYRNFLTLLAIGFAVWFIWNFYILIAYFFIAGIVSLLGRPVVEFMDNIQWRRFKIPRWVSALVAMLVIVAVIGGMMAVFIPLLEEQAEIISSVDFVQVANRLEEPLVRLERFLIDMEGSSEKVTLEGFISSKLESLVSVTSLTSIVNGILGSLGSIAVGIFSIVFISFFFLRDEKLLYQIIMVLTPTRWEENVQHILSGSKKTLTRYFGGILIKSTVVTVLITVGLWIMGFQYALLIGFFCGIVNIIPYLGPIIGTLFALLITITTTLNSTPDADIGLIAIQLVALIQGVQLFDNYVSQPYIFSKRMKAHPLEIFFIVLVFGSLAGIAGMIMAVPVYSFLRLVAREFFSEFKIVRKMTENLEQ